mgnify:CR=1 FL=1
MLGCDLQVWPIDSIDVGKLVLVKKRKKGKHLG